MFTELRMRRNNTHKIDPSWLSATARTKFSGTGKKLQQSSFKTLADVSAKLYALNCSIITGLL